MTSYRQTYKNSCGAATLLCAIIDLGYTHLPADPSLHPLWVGGADLTKGPTKQAETIIYAVTSGCDRCPDNGSGYSLPSRIAKVCQAIDLKAQVYVPSEIVPSLLLLFYPNEMSHATRNGMETERTAPPKPIGNELLLRVIRVGGDRMFGVNLGLHYVLERPNNWVMDPALGWEHSSLDQLILFHKKMYQTSYVDSGLGILLSKNN